MNTFKLSTTRILFLVFALMFIVNQSQAQTNYYSNTSGTLDQLTSWGVNSDGSGANPPDFMTANQVFNIVSTANTTISPTVSTTLGSAVITFASAPSNAVAGQMISGTGIPANTIINSVSGTSVNISNAATATGSGITVTSYSVFTIANTWAVSGAGSEVVIGDGTNPVTFTVPSGILFSSVTTSISNNAAINNQNASETTTSLGACSVTGTYQHNVDGGNIPTATWNTGSNCDVVGVVSTVPANLSQNFYNFLWNCIGETSGSLSFNNNFPTGINGTCEFRSDGTGQLNWNFLTAGGTKTWAGDLIVSGSHVLMLTNSTTAAVTFNIRDLYINTNYLTTTYVKTNNTSSNTTNLTWNMRNLSISGTSTGGFLDFLGITYDNTTINMTGNLTMAGGKIYVSSAGGSAGTCAVKFSGTTQQNVNISGISAYAGIAGGSGHPVTFTANSGSIVNFQTDFACGTGASYVTFTAANGSTLMIPDANGIIATAGTASGSVQTPTTGGGATFNTGVNYTYDGTATQVTGTGLPATVNNLTLNNSVGITVPAEAVSGILTVTNSTATITGSITVTGATSITGSTVSLTGGTLTTNGTLALSSSPLSLSGGAVAANGNITMTSSLVTLVNNNFTIGGTATLTGTFGTTNMFVTTGTGQLVKIFNAAGTFAYPMGDNSPAYSPFTFTYTGGTFVANTSSLGAKVTVGEESNITGSNYINRYWTLTENISGGVGNATFNYNAGDVVGIESSIYGVRYSGIFPTGYGLVNTGTHTINASGITAFSTVDFTGGPNPPEIDCYRTAQSGNWNSASTWQVQLNCTGGWVSATTFPTATNSSSILIQNGNVVTVTANVVADQVSFDNNAGNSTISINSGINFTIANGKTVNGESGNDLDFSTNTNARLIVNGNIINEGIIANSSAGTTSFNTGSNYDHQQDGGTIPLATWNTGSNCNINGMVSTVPANMTQNFYNFLWDNPSQTSVANFGSANFPSGIANTFEIRRCGTSSQCNWDPPTPLTWAGDIVISANRNIIATSATTVASTFTVRDVYLTTTYGSASRLIGSNENSGSQILTFSMRNLYVEGGTFDYNGIEPNNTNVNLSGNLTMTSGAILASNSGYTAGTDNFYFSGTTQQNVNITGGTISGNNSNGGGGGSADYRTIAITANSGSIVNFVTPLVCNIGGTSVLVTFTAAAGSTLMIPDPAGILSTAGATTGSVRIPTGGTVTFNAGANYIYTGSVAQVTGTGLPASLTATLTMDNTSATGVTLSQSTSLTGNLALTAGQLILSTLNLTLGNASTISGTFSSSNMIVANSTGQLIRNYPAGASNFTFPIGDATPIYSPLTIDLIANSAAGTIGARVVNGTNPNMNTGSTPSDYLNRYFVLTSATIANYAYNLNFAYANGDVVGNSNNLELSNWNGTAWVAYSSTNTSNTMASNGNLAGSSAPLNGAQLTGRDGTPSLLYYRSAGAGPADWNTASSWQTDITPAFANPITAAAVPTSTNSVSIHIQSGDIITAAAAVTASYLYVDGTLQLNTGGTFTGATQFDAGSFYVHNQNGGTIPTATWNATSTCTITGTTTISPTGISGQTFGAFTWDNTSQSIAATLGLASASTIIFNGAFTLQSTGTGTLSFTSGVSATVDLNGDLVIQSGTLNMNNSGAFITTLNLAGNYNQTGGAFQTGAATSTQALNFNNAGVNKNYIQSAGTVSNTGIAYTVNSGAIVTLSNNIAVPTSFTVSGALYCGTNIISGEGTFTLSSANTVTLGIGSAAGINNAPASIGNIETINATFGILANYIYTSSSGQATGSALTGANNLTFNCPTVTLSNNASVSGAVALNGSSGTVVTLGNYSLTTASLTSTSGYSTSNDFVTNGTGQLIELVPALGTYTFPVGDNTPSYTPCTFTYTAGTFSGSTYLGARVRNSEEPNVTGSNYLNRYWSLLDNITGGVGNGTFYYHAGSPDVVGTESNIYGVSYGVSGGGGSAAYGLVNAGTHTISAGSASLNPGTTYDFTGGSNISTLLWFQSVASGNWNSASTWQSSSTSISGPWTAATVSPNAYNSANVAGAILIQNGNQVTVAANVDVANVLLDNNAANSSIIVNSGDTLTVINGTGNDINFSTNTNPRLIVNGALMNYSTINGSTATTTTINGSYIHPQDGGTVPSATWNTNSICIITGEVSSNGPANLTQNFYNFLWDCPAQTAAVQMDGNIPTGIAGTCEFRRMGTSSQCNLIASDGITRTWAGDLIVSANKIILCVTSSGDAATTLNVRDVYINTTYGANAHMITSNMGSTANYFTLNCRNISIDGGFLDYNGIYQNNSTINMTGNLTMVGGTIYNSNGLTAGTSALNFSGTTQQNINISAGAVIKGLSSSVNRTITITANSGSIVNFQTDLTCGTGSSYVTFTAASGSTLMIPDPNGIVATAGATTGSVQTPTTGGGATFNAAANYIYTGSAAQVTGAGLPAALTGKLTIDNTSATGVTLSASLTGPIGNLTLTAGQLILGSDNLTLAAASTISGAPYSTSNMVVASGTGKLIKTYPVGATNFMFPIGDATPVYSPVTLNFLANGTQGTVGISVANGTPPGTLPTDYLTRYFIVSGTTIANYAYTIDFNYANGDVHGSSTNLLLQQWNGTSWTAFTSTSTGNAMTLTGDLSAIGAPLTTATCYFGALDGTAQVTRLYYESAGVGPADWNTAASWLTANNPSFTGAITAAAVPTSANSMSIWIRPGHTITAAAAMASGSFLTVDGTLQENTGASITTVFPIAFTSTGTYVHNLNAGVIPTAAWNATSTCNIIGTTSTAPTGLAQAYGNLIWNCGSQTVAAIMAYPTGPTTIQGNVTIDNTNTSTVALASAASTVNIGGYLSIQGGTLYMNSTTTSTTLNVAGNLTIGGGTFNLDNANAAQTLNIGGNYNQTGGTFTQTGTTASTVSFTGANTSYTQSAGTVTNTYINYAINTTGASLTLANDINVAASRSFTVTIGTLTIPNGLYINGAGSFVLANANTATLVIGDQNGINSSGATGNVQSTTRTFSAGANYTYNGSTSQITGTGLVTTNNLTFANTSGSSTGVTLSGAVNVNGTLALASGLVTLAAYNLTLPATASLSGTPSVTNMLVTNGTGQFVRGIGVTSSNTSFLFPVGDATPYYTPVTLTFSSNSSAGTVGINTINNTESNMNNPSVPTSYLSRYWTFSNTGLSSYDYTGTFAYPTADLSGSQSILRLSQWTGSSWNEYTGSSASTNVLTETTALTQVTGALTGDFTGRTQSPPCSTDMWIGGTSGYQTDWFTASNWSCGIVPLSTTNVEIPSVGVTYFPDIVYTSSHIAYAQNLQIDAGATLTIDPVNIELDVTGNLINNGTNSLGNGTLKTITTTGAQTISGNVSVVNLLVSNPAGVTITLGVGNSLSVSGTLTLALGTLYTNGNLTITSTSSGTGEIDNFSGTNSGTISGNLTVQRYAVNPTPSHITGISYYFIGAPVGGATISQWNDEFTNTAINGASDGSYVIPTASCSDVNLASNSPYGGLFDYNESVVTTCNQSGWQTRFSGTIPAGQGFAGQVSNGTIVALTGSFNTGNISTPALTVTATNLTETPGFGWNLISNPYAAPIAWSEVAAANSHISGTAYTYITSGSLAGTYNPNNNISEGEIGSSEAFWVEATTNGTTVNFTNSMETDGGNAFLRTAPAWDQMLSMNVSGNGYNDLLRVAFGSKFTDGFDRGYDAHKLMGNSIQPNLFVTDSIAKYCIYAIPTVTQNERDIPVSFTAGTSGQFSFSVDLNGFDPTALVFLEDLQTHTLQNLMVNNTYSFTSNVSDDPARFVLHFVPAAVITSSNADCKGNDGAIQVDLGKYNVDNTTITWNTYALKDNDGNTVAVGANVNGELNINNVAGGTYELQLTYGSYVATEAVTVTGVTLVSTVFTINSNQVSPGETVQFTNTTTGASTFDWSFGDGTTSDLQDPTHSYAEAGVYNVVLTAGNGGCSGTYDQTVTVQSTTGINTPNPESVAINGYANQVNILFHSFSTLNEVTLNIYDLTGRKIITTQEIATGDSRHIINMNDVTNGYYFVVLTGNGYEKSAQVYLDGNN